MQELIESHVGQDHFDIVVQAMAEGMVVPLLGAGVNLCGRPAGAGWEHGRYLPDGAELATFLAGHFRFPEDELADLRGRGAVAAALSRPDLRTRGGTAGEGRAATGARRHDAGRW